jgi:Fic family protein
MKKKTEITHDEWIRELLPSIIERPPNSFTIDEAVEITGMKRSTTSRAIMDKVKKGELIKVKCNYLGRISYCFLKANKK